ncbi:MAG: cell division protein ZapA [Clostridia bacterium]|nr:cell division protein ZapA [Clostridia bacterium]
MDELRNRVTVTIFNEEYVIRGDAREEHIRAVARRVDQRMREIAAQRPNLSVSRIAVLAALNLADELVRLSEQHERVVGLLEREWERRGAAAGQGGRPEARPETRGPGEAAGTNA